jgi:lactoylglutathione lyase
LQEPLWTTILVKDLEKSLEFYRDFIGLKINRRFAAGPNQEIVFLGNGETEVELIENKQESFTAGNAITLGFAVDSLDETIKLLKEKSINIISDIIQPNPNIKFIYVLDPNGVKVQFSESLH